MTRYGANIIMSQAGTAFSPSVPPAPSTSLRADLSLKNGPALTSTGPDHGPAERRPADGPAAAPSQGAALKIAAPLSTGPGLPFSAAPVQTGPTHAAGAIRHTARQPSRRARIVVVASGKGGVGKTHISANLAIGLAVAGQRVLLVDADLGLANVDLVLGERPRADLGHVISGRMPLDRVVQQGPAGIHWIPGASYLSADGMSDRRREDLLSRLSALETQHDFIILDAPAGIGRGVLHLAQQADHLILVTTPEPTAMMDAYALLKSLGQMTETRTRAAARPPSSGPSDAECPPAAGTTGLADAPRKGIEGDVRLIVNMVTHRADADQVQHRINAAARRFLGVPVGLLGFVYCDGHVMQAMRRQQPVVLAYPHSQAAWCIKRLAGNLIEATHDGAAGKFAFFRRLARFFLAG
jgi:flagellar biosynthesis protein FlhG